ncbi:SCO2400 family protein, partial [Kitasatospora sp. P5_F3]
MDYCAPCRRHLNGALSCPGCGAPASAAAPVAAPRDTAPTVAPRAASRRRRRRRGPVVAATALALAVG